MRNQVCVKYSNRKCGQSTGGIVKVGKVIKVLTANVYKRRANLIAVVRYWLNKPGFAV